MARAQRLTCFQDRPTLEIQLSAVDEWVRAGGADEDKVNDSTGNQA
jgi:hypothetical protein